MSLLTRSEQELLLIGLGVALFGLWRHRRGARTALAAGAGPPAAPARTEESAPAAATASTGEPGTALAAGNNHPDQGLPPDLGEAPDSAPYYKFYAEKWGQEQARNALLHFIAARGLDAECSAWLDRHYPDDRD